MNTPVIYSEACVNLVKKFEGLHKVQKDGMIASYRCPAGKWTIGWGHTKGVRSGQKITVEQAEDFLRQDLEECCNQVIAAVKVDLSQAQLDALVSFVFNLGIGNFQSSTLLKKLNRGDYDGAATEFSKWNKARDAKTGVLGSLPGLTRRRTAEAALFSMDAPLGDDGTLMPQKPQSEALKPLTQSKTIAGATIAGASTVIGETASQLEPLSMYHDYIKYAFLALTLVGIGLVTYARFKDHKEGIH